MRHGAQLCRAIHGLSWGIEGTLLLDKPGGGYLSVGGPYGTRQNGTGAIRLVPGWAGVLSTSSSWPGFLFPIRRAFIVLCAWWWFFLGTCSNIDLYLTQSASSPLNGTHFPCLDPQLVVATSNSYSRTLHLLRQTSFVPSLSSPPEPSPNSLVVVVAIRTAGAHRITYSSHPEILLQ